MLRWEAGPEAGDAVTMPMSIRCAGAALLGWVLPSSASAAPIAFATADGLGETTPPSVFVALRDRDDVWVVAPGWGQDAGEVAVVLAVPADADLTVLSQHDVVVGKLLQDVAPAELSVSCADLYPFTPDDTGERRDTGREPVEEDAHPRLRHSSPGPLACNRGRRPYYYYGYGYYRDYDYDTDYDAYEPYGYGSVAVGSRVDAATDPGLREAIVLESTVLADAGAVDAWMVARDLVLEGPLTDVEGQVWAVVRYQVDDAEPGRLPAFEVRAADLSHLRIDVAPRTTDLIWYGIELADSPMSLGVRGPGGVEKVTVETNCLMTSETVDAAYAEAVSRAMGEVGGRARFAIEHVTAPAQCVGCSGVSDLGDYLPALGWENGNFNTAVSRLRVVVDADAGHDELGFDALPAQTPAFTAFVRYLDELESDLPVCGSGFVEAPGSCFDGEVPPQRRRAQGGRAGALGTIGTVLLGVGLLVAGRRRGA